MNVMSIVMLLVLIAVMYFLMIRPQRKKEKEINEMRNAVKVGDDVITIGGICGKIVKTKEDVLTIQVGADKTKFEIMRWAVSKVVSESTEKQVKVSKKEDAEEESPRSLPKRLKPKSSDEAGAEDERDEDGADAPETEAEESAKQD
ncbi:MAG: preprotein translocase subunit YajC [Clostridiales Family XIII bacterium]|nr:preprotein translocase subunit YajC [Clostridiales Family XIII bacterium]